MEQKNIKNSLPDHALIINAEESEKALTEQVIEYLES
jgi:hypothetical protein